MSHVRKSVDWSFTSSQVISSIFILWWKTARPGILVTVTTYIWSPKGLFGFHFKSRWAYFLSGCKSPWQSWCLKNFLLFFRLFWNQGNEWEALLNNRLIMAKGRRVKLNRTSEGMKTKESLFSNEFAILPVVIGKWEEKLMPSGDLLVSPLAPLWCSALVLSLVPRPENVEKKP